MARLTGSCHCGDVRFEVEGEPSGLEVCNCSICRRTGYVHWYVAPERFHLATPESALRTYTFGTHRARHHFCARCGVSPYRRARSNPLEVEVNVRCLDDVDVDRMPVRRFDGRHWEEAMAGRGGAQGYALRPLAGADTELEALVRLWMHTKLETPPWGDLPTERGYSFEGNLRYFRDQIVPRCEVDVAVDDAGRVGGFLAQHGREVELLFVAPAHQGRGVGTALLARARGPIPEGLELFALEANRAACRFYERHGFRVLARGTSPPPESAPDVRYGWTPEPAP